MEISPSNQNFVSRDDYLGQVPFVVGISQKRGLDEETVLAVALTLFLTVSSVPTGLSLWGQDALRAGVSNRLLST